MSLATWQTEGFPEVAALSSYPVLGDGLPDPLRFFDGSQAVSAADLDARRAEVRAAATFYQFGETPPSPAVTASVAYDAVEWGGSGRLRGIDITLDGAVTFRILVMTPTAGSGPYPVVIGDTNHPLPSILPTTVGYPGATGAQDDVNWVEAISRGYAVVMMQAYSVCDNHTVGPLFTHYQSAGAGGPYSWGALRAWAWLYSSLLDYAETDADLDHTRAVVAGHSRRGKASLCCGLYDERWAGVVSLQSGTGGAGPFRDLGYSPHETIDLLTSTWPSWWRTRFADFSAYTERLPYDANVLIGVQAPRPYLVLTASGDNTTAPRQEYAVLESAAPPFVLLGETVVVGGSMPAEGVLELGALAFWRRAGSHNWGQEEWPPLLDFHDTLAAAAPPGGGGGGVPGEAIILRGQSSGPLVLYPHRELDILTGVPGAPQNVVATAGDRLVEATWGAPASDGGAAITGYVAELVHGSTDAVVASKSVVATSVAFGSVDGVTNGTPYYVRVRATNAVGSSPLASSNYVTPAAAAPGTVPGVVQNLSASAGNQQVSATWSAPASDGGAAITGYFVELVIGTTDGVVASRNVVGASVTFGPADNVVNGSPYFVRVRATNAVGNGAAATSNTVTPQNLAVQTEPGEVQALVASAGDRTVSAAWEPPADTGNAAITGYVVELLLAGSGGTTSGPVASRAGYQGTYITFGSADAVANGTAYEVRVAAVNAVGAGLPVTSDAVTPDAGAALPGAPQNVVATPGARPGTATVSWAPPASDGGSAIIRYRITLTPSGA